MPDSPARDHVPKNTDRAGSRNSPELPRPPVPTAPGGYGECFGNSGYLPPRLSIPGLKRRIVRPAAIDCDAVIARDQRLGLADRRESQLAISSRLCGSQLQRTADEINGAGGLAELLTVPSLASAIGGAEPPLTCTARPMA
jgi:hypothetical protein